MKSMLLRCAAIVGILFAMLLAAAASAETQRGNCGKNFYPYTEYDEYGEPHTVYRNDHVQWELTDDGQLTIWGSEDMYDYYPCGPWGKNVCSVTILNGVTSIGGWAFFECKNLTSVSIPSSVREIGEKAFAKSGLTSVTVPSTVTTLGIEIFFECNELASVSVNCKEVADDMFEGCTNLTDVQFGGNVTSIGEDAFRVCTSLKSISIPAHITQIGEEAFAGCTSLKNVCLSEGLKSIERLAFSACSSLTSMVIPDSIEFMGESVFAGCSELTTLTLPYLDEDKSENGMGGLEWLFSGRLYSNGCSKKLTTIILTKSVHLAGEAFSSYELRQTIQTIILPDTLVSIGHHAFFHLENLREITLPDALVEINYRAFTDCTGLMRMEIPDSVETMGDYVFENCTALKEVVLPEGLRELGEYAFKDCAALQKVNIPDSLTELKHRAFIGCESLTQVEISPTSRLERLDRGLFEGCNALDSVFIPDCARDIDGMAFAGCPNLTIRCSHYSEADRVAGYRGNPVSYTDPAPETLVSLRLPEELSVIEAEAFLGTAATGAEIPAGCAVGSRAFADSDDLRALFVRDMEVSLPADVISGSAQACVYCYRDSQAAADCEAYGISCKYLF